jgi:hypothetical protein
MPSSYLVSSTGNTKAARTGPPPVKELSSSTYSSLNEDRSVIRFTASIDDAGKKLGCRARNINITAAVSAMSSPLETSDSSSSSIVGGGIKEDTRVLVVHGLSI